LFRKNYTELFVRDTARGEKIELPALFAPILKVPSMQKITTAPAVLFDCIVVGN
jgi:hypothetical protein